MLLLLSMMMFLLLVLVEPGKKELLEVPHFELVSFNSADLRLHRLEQAPCLERERAGLRVRCARLCLCPELHGSIDGLGRVRTVTGYLLKFCAHRHASSLPCSTHLPRGLTPNL